MKRSYYIVEGNTVRKADAALPAHPKSTIYERQKKADQRYRASGMLNARYVGFLLLMTLICAAVCIPFLHLQNQAIVRSENITALEEQIENLRKENNALEARINTSTTLTDVRKKAEALGMQATGVDQIKFYHVTKDDYMVQMHKIK